MQEEPLKYCVWLCSSQPARLPTGQLYSNKRNSEIFLVFTFPNCTTAFLLVSQMFHPSGWLRKQQTCGCPVCSFHECLCFFLHGPQRGGCWSSLGESFFFFLTLIATPLSELRVSFLHGHVCMVLTDVIAVCGYVIWAASTHTRKIKARSNDTCDSARKPSTALPFFP